VMSDASDQRLAVSKKTVMSGKTGMSEKVLRSTF